MRTIKTYLPLFPGFYNTIFEPDCDMELEYLNEQSDKLITYDDCEWDYKATCDLIAIDCCEFIAEEFEGLVTSVRFEKVVSPKFYNFGNDSINCEISVTEENEAAILEYVNLNMEEFEEYLRDKYTSRPGFISHYPNNSQEFLQGDPLGDQHKLGSILNFICVCSEMEEMDMYEACNESIYMTATKITTL